MGVPGRVKRDVLCLLGGHSRVVLDNQNYHGGDDEYPFEKTLLQAQKGGKKDKLDGLAGLVKRTMGFILRHEYGLGKGTDRVLYDYFKEACKTDKLPRLYTVLSHERGKRSFDESSNDKPKVKCDLYSLTAQELEYHTVVGGGGKPAPPVDKGVQFVRGEWGEDAGTKLAHYHQQGAEHTGNETLPEEYEYVYLQSALVVSEGDLK